MTKILVVDDEPAFRELLKTILESLQYAVDTAEDGPQALEKLRKGSFDLAFLDLLMPGMSGLETLRIIRNDAKLKKLPVLVCTSVSMTKEVDAAYEIGANGYIVKTMINANKISDKVKTVLGV